jgi:hypothetical protein
MLQNQAKCLTYNMRMNARLLPEGQAPRISFMARKSNQVPRKDLRGWAPQAAGADRKTAAPATLRRLGFAGTPWKIGRNTRAYGRVDGTVGERACSWKVTGSETTR